METIDFKSVKFLRNHLGLSQEELADSLGVHKNTIYRAEAGDRPISKRLESLIHQKYGELSPKGGLAIQDDELQYLRKKVQELTRELEQMKRNFQLLLETHSKQLVNDKKGGVSVTKSVTLVVDHHAMAA